LRNGWINRQVTLVATNLPARFLLKSHPVWHPGGRFWALQFASVCTSVKIKLLYLWLLPNNFVFVIYILAMLICLLWWWIHAGSKNNFSIKILTGNEHTIFKNWMVKHGLNWSRYCKMYPSTDPSDVGTYSFLRVRIIRFWYFCFLWACKAVKRGSCYNKPREIRSIKSGLFIEQGKLKVPTSTILRYP
jgi:hypothetical protein